MIQPSSNGEPLFLVDAASGEIRGNPAASEDMLTEGRYDMTVHRSSSSPRTLTVSRAFRLIVGREVDELPPAIVVEPPEQPLDPLMIEPIPTPVIVAANATMSAVVLTASLSGGRNASFAPVTEGDFRAVGGVEATVSLARAATAMFAADELELFLTLTASDDDDQEATAIVRFVSAARGFDGAGLFKSIAASMLPAGMSLFAASDAALTIWHVFGGEKRYELLGANVERFTVGADGAVSVKADFSLDADARYDLTLVLRGGEAEARRDLTLELLSPFLGAAEESPVTVAADAAAARRCLLCRWRGKRACRLTGLRRTVCERKAEMRRRYFYRRRRWIYLRWTDWSCR